MLGSGENSRKGVQVKPLQKVLPGTKKGSPMGQAKEPFVVLVSTFPS